MKNFIQRGETLTLTAPADVVGGNGIVVNNWFGIAVASVLSGEQMALLVEGVVELPKKSGLVVAEGEALGWDISEAELVAFNDVNEDIVVGIATKASLGGDANAQFKLERPVLT